MKNRNITVRANLLIGGIVLGMAEAGILAALIAGDRIGLAGFAGVVVLALLAGFGGWMIGMQMRVRVDRDRAFMQGYKQGREGQLVSTERRFTTILVGGWGR